ncbi:hypothetical protein MesoLjLa_48170 [Mesorhizobium sp. L-2-11]|nr:hypothetical protein MesoLjLa_48170 [Mesorhizobium sp. L-2-11]
MPLGEQKRLHRFRFGIDAHDGVGASVGTNDHPVRRRAVAKGYVLERASIRIEPPKRALSLGGIPYGAIRRRSDIVRAGALRNGIVADFLRSSTRGHRAEQRGEQCRRNRTKTWPTPHIARFYLHSERAKYPFRATAAAEPQMASSPCRLPIKVRS